MGCQRSGIWYAGFLESTEFHRAKAVVSFCEACSCSRPGGMVLNWRALRVSPAPLCLCQSNASCAQFFPGVSGGAPAAAPTGPSTPFGQLASYFIQLCCSPEFWVDCFAKREHFLPNTWPKREYPNLGHTVAKNCLGFTVLSSPFLRLWPRSQALG